MAGAYEIPGQTITLEAGADLSTRQFHFVDVNSSGQAVLAGNAGRVVGVLQNKPAAAVGSPCTVMINGVSKMVNGVAGALAAGAHLMSDATGRAIVAATAGSETAGVALTGAAAQNELIAGAIAPSFTV